MSFPYQTRIIFRLVDYGLVGEGKSGEITSHEAFEFEEELLDATYYDRQLAHGIIHG